MELPLFPLHSVLCPGVALPLHIFEERYRLMVARCIERSEPFGVILIREGREVGALDGRLAEVGTTALIRRADRFPDGRFNIVAVGSRRFRLGALDATREPYLVGQVTLLDEAIGGDLEADQLRRQVGRRFLRYLELLQPLGTDDGPEIEIEVEFEIADEDAPAVDVSEPYAIRMGDAAPVDREPDLSDALEAAQLTEAQRRELLLASARRLTATDDATALSYLLTGLVQLDPGARQDLLEADDTVGRLHGLDALLRREIRHLNRHLRPINLDPRGLALRRN